MNWFNSLFFRAKEYIKSGFTPWNIWGFSPQFNDYQKDIEKMIVVFNNPAVLKVFTLQCDLFSLAKVYVYDKNGKEILNDPAIRKLNSPNPMQDRSQFLWDFMFWKMVGNAYLYITSNIVDRDNAPMYWLIHNKMEWPLDIRNFQDKLIQSNTRLNEILDKEITYRYDDGTTLKIPLRKIKAITDLTNGTGNWFKGNSRLEALYKVISNSEISLDSKNINVRYTSKFLVSGQQDPKDVQKTPMSETEKQDIETKINGDKQVHAVKSMVDIKRFVSDLRVLELDKSFLADFYVIGMLYNIPRDVLEAYMSSTFENQEKARAGHVSYTLDPAGESFAGILEKVWSYDLEGKKIVFSWDHLPFAQVFERDRAAIQQTKVNTLVAMLRAGLKLEEINIFLDTNFTEVETTTNETNGQKAIFNGSKSH